MKDLYTDNNLNYIRYMQCPTPISIKDKSEKNPNKLASIRQTVPCGRCGICKKNKRNEWTFRLREQLKDSWNCKFLTLTYSNDNLPYNYKTGEVTVRKKHMQDFVKRLREYEYRKTKKRRFKYYIVGEYGTKTNRPHYHCLGFNLSKYAINNLDSVWQYGHTDIGTVTSASIHYVTKYHVNRNTYEDDPVEREPEFALQSQKIGYGYIDRNRKYHLETGNTFVYLDGYKINMPRIFKEKIFEDTMIKHMSEENIENARQANRKEAERLEKIGYKDGYYELFKRTIKKSQKVKQKNTEAKKGAL